MSNFTNTILSCVYSITTQKSFPNQTCLMSKLMPYVLLVEGFKKGSRWTPKTRNSEISSDSPQASKSDPIWDLNLQIIFYTNYEFCPTKLVLCLACGRIQKGFQMDPQISEFGERSKSREGKIRVSEFRDLDPPGKVILRLSTSKQLRPDLGFKSPNHF